MIIYTAGPYSAYEKFTIHDNIKIARKIAIEVWQAGHIAICPHLNTADFQIEMPDVSHDYWLDRDYQIIARCDAILMLPNWEESKGAKMELYYANEHQIPVYYYPDIPSLHPTEVNSPVQAQSFIRLVMHLYRVHLDKNADYSPANILGTGEIGIVTRIWDKMARMFSISGFDVSVKFNGYSGPKETLNESLMDTFYDMAVYAIIGILHKRGQWGH